MRTRPLALATAVTLALAACSTQEPPAAPGDAAATTTAVPDTAQETTAAPPDDVEVTTAPALGQVEVSAGVGDAADLARDLYAGRPVAMDPAVAEVLTDEHRRAGAEQDREVTGSTGEWEGTPVAMLASGDDLTLAVEEDGGWVVVGGRWPSLGVQDTVPGGTLAVLLAGSDARPGQRVDRSRADALQLVVSDGRGGGAVVGIARDSWVPIPGHGTDKVNAALVRGGPDLLVRTVQEATGVPLEGYLLVGFEEFKAVVEDAGGLPFVLQAAVRVMWAELPEGAQELTGPQALAFARERQNLPDGDFGRSRRQGDLVLAALGLALDGGAEELPGLMTVLSEHADTDLDAREAVVLVGRALVTDPALVGHDVLRGPTGWSADGQSIVRWADGAEAILEDLEDGRLDAPLEERD